VELRTDCDSLGVEVGLHIGGVDTDPFKVNLVLDIGHEDEGCYDTCTLGSAGLGANLAVPDVMCGCQKCSNCALCHCQESRLLLRRRVGVYSGHALRLPVDLGGIAEVLVNRLNIVEIIERVLSRLAYGAGDAGVEGVRHEGIASAEAESADTAVAIYCEFISIALWIREPCGTHESSRVCPVGSGYPLSISRPRELCPQILPQRRRQRVGFEPWLGCIRRVRMSCKVQVWSAGIQGRATTSSAVIVGRAFLVVDETTGTTGDVGIRGVVRRTRENSAVVFP
jgi:hypothetical protein